MMSLTLLLTNFQGLVGFVSSSQRQGGANPPSINSLAVVRKAYIGLGVGGGHPHILLPSLRGGIRCGSPDRQSDRVR